MSLFLFRIEFHMNFLLRNVYMLASHCLYSFITYSALIKLTSSDRKVKREVWRKRDFITLWLNFLDLLFYETFCNIHTFIAADKKGFLVLHCMSDGFWLDSSEMHACVWEEKSLQKSVVIGSLYFHSLKWCQVGGKRNGVVILLLFGGRRQRKRGYCCTHHNHHHPNISQNACIASSGVVVHVIISMGAFLHLGGADVCVRAYL